MAHQQSLTLLNRHQNLKTQHLGTPRIGKDGEVQHFGTSSAFSIKLKNEGAKREATRNESRDIVCDPILPLTSQNSHVRIVGTRHSTSTFRSSPPTSRPSSPSSFRPSLPSTVTSASIYTVDGICEYKSIDSSTGSRRPSMLARLRSSISTSSCSQGQQQLVTPADFRRPPECPEKHFIDSVGMVIPGVSNHDQCSHPLAHFVLNWRLCEPIEYTTALADHGITYSDYCRLLATIENFLEDIPIEPKPNKKNSVWRWPRKERESSTTPGNVGMGTGHPAESEKEQRRPSLDSVESSFRRIEQRAEDLNQLLAEITFHWRARGLPVMVCIGSFSLFTPNRIHESHVQVLHVPLPNQTPEEENVDQTKQGQRLSFVDPLSRLITTKDVETHCVSGPRRRFSEHSQGYPSSSSRNSGQSFHHHQFQARDRSRPWPLWPNAIPSSKRDLINNHADRYGVDPYFRAWMRANINSRTKSTSYAKFMIEQEDNPFINKRLEFVTPPSLLYVAWGICTKGMEKMKKQCPIAINRGHYEHNRRLECRKTVEHGSRLRIARFGFLEPLYPPHTPEMDELGLTEESYRQIISDIEKIRRGTKRKSIGCFTIMPSNNGLLFRLFQKRSTEDALTKVSEYIRHVNSAQRGVVWTIEKIPSVHHGPFKYPAKEWEISVWNAEDSLELLLELERWSIIPKKLDIDDEE